MTGASDRRVRLVTVAVGVAGILAGLTATASAQDISVNFGQGNGLTERVIQLVALLTVLSLAPSILVMAVPLPLLHQAPKDTGPNRPGQAP